MLLVIHLTPLSKETQSTVITGRAPWSSLGLGASLKGAVVRGFMDHLKQFDPVTSGQTACIFNHSTSPPPPHVVVQLLVDLDIV